MPRPKLRNRGNKAPQINASTSLKIVESTASLHIPSSCIRNRTLLDNSSIISSKSLSQSIKKSQRKTRRKLKSNSASLSLPATATPTESKTTNKNGSLVQSTPYSDQYPKSTSGLSPSFDAQTSVIPETPKSFSPSNSRIIQVPSQSAASTLQTSRTLRSQERANRQTTPIETNVILAHHEESRGSQSILQSRVPGSTNKVSAYPNHDISVVTLQNYKRRQRQPSFLRLIQQCNSAGQSDLHDSEAFVSTPQDGAHHLWLNNVSHIDSDIFDSSENLDSTYLTPSRSYQWSRSRENTLIPASSPPLLNSPPAPPPPPLPLSSPSARHQITGNSKNQNASDVLVMQNKLHSQPERINQSNPLHSDTLASPLPSSAINSLNTSPSGRDGSCRLKNSMEFDINTLPSKLTTSILQNLLPRPRRMVYKRSNMRDFQDVSLIHEDSSDCDTRWRINRRTAKGQGPKAQQKTGHSTGVSAEKKTYARKSLRVFNSSDSLGSTSEYSQSNEGQSFQITSALENRTNVTVNAPAATTTAISESTSSKELKQMAKKFAQVDAWEMDFESVSQSHEDESSS